MSLPTAPIRAGHCADLRTDVLKRSLLPLELLQNCAQTIWVAAVRHNKARLKTSNQLCSQRAVALFCGLRQPISQICRYAEIYLGVCACHARNVRHHSA